MADFDIESVLAESGNPSRIASGAMFVGLEELQEELVQIDFRSLIPEEMGFEEDFFTLGFDPALVRLWKDKEKTDEVSNSTKFPEDEGPFRVWMEGVSMGESHIRLIWHERIGIIEVPQFDSIKFSTYGIDVDIDSNNNGVIEGSDWEEELESSPYAFGKLIEPGNNFYDLHVKLAKGLNPNDRIQFEYSNNNATVMSDRGEVQVHYLDDNNIKQPIHLWKVYKLSELNYDPVSGHLVGLSFKSRWNSSIRSLKTYESIAVPGGLKDDPIRVHYKNHQNGIKSTDAVKYVVTDSPSIFWEMQNRIELRSALASRGVYGETLANGDPDHIPSDMPEFALKRLSKQELNELGVPVEVAALLFNENNPGDNGDGFKAALYQDYTAVSDNTYILTFAGTDGPSLNDWVENIRQGGGWESTQYEKGLNVGKGLREVQQDNPEFKFTIAGHSLGGGLASAAYTVTGWHTYTVNSAGLNPKTLEHFLPNDEYTVAMGRFLEAPLFVEARFVDYDILSAVQDTSLLASDALGWRMEMDGPYDVRMGLSRAAVLSAITGHPVTRFVAVLGHAARVTYMGLAHKNDAVLYGLLADRDGENLHGYVL